MNRVIACLLLATLSATAKAGSYPTEDDVLTSTREHYPIISQSILQVLASENELKAARGNFDSKIVSNNHWVPVGVFVRRYVDVQVEKPLPFANSKVYVGYSHGFNPGYFPPQFSTMSTNHGGAPRVGAYFSLMRGLMIDERRAAVRRSQYGLQKSKVDVQFTQIQVTRDSKLAYWAWVSGVRNYAVYKRLLDVAEARKGVLDQRLSAGDISEVVAKENLQYVARRRADLASAELTMKQTALDLSLFLRSSDGEPFVSHHDSEEGLVDMMQARARSVEAELDAGQLPVLDASQLTQRPDVLSLRKEILMNDVDLKYFDNQLMPKFDLHLDYTKNIGREDPTNGQHVLTVYFNLEIPIEYNLIQGNLRAVQAERSLLNSRYNFLLENVDVEINKLNETMRLARDRMHNAQQEMEYAAQLLEAENYKFTRGGSNFFLINIREEARAEAEAKYIYAQYDLISAHAQYRAATAQAKGME